MRTILVYGLKNVVGGIENYLLMMHKYLHNDLKFVFLVEETENFIYEMDISQYGGIIEFLPERHNLSKYKMVFTKLLSKYHENTNTLYVNVGHISFDIIPINIAIRSGYRVITHSHNAMQEPIKRLDYRIRQTILRTLAMKRLRSIDVKRLAVSDAAGVYLYHEKPYEIITPGIEPNKFIFDENKRKEYRQKLKIDDCIVLGYVGRLVSVKNPLFLIDVLKEMKNLGQRAKLLILGEGVLKEEIVTKATEVGVFDSILLMGTVINVQDYLQAMDVLLAPSLSEGLGLFIVEAQAAGLPCVCADGNIPSQVNVTGNVKFEKLNNGANAWCSDVLTLLDKRIDRFDVRTLIEKSDFNIKKASEKLYKIIKDVSETRQGENS